MPNTKNSFIHENPWQSNSYFIFLFLVYYIFYFRYLDMGDINDQLALKEKLKCKSFQWYMDNIAYDVLDKYPELPPNLHFGELR